MYGSGKPAPCAGAAGAPALTVERGQHAVRGHAGANVRGGRRPVAGVEMLFLAIEHQLDRRLRLLRELRADESLCVRTRTCCRIRRPCTA